MEKNKKRGKRKAGRKEKESDDASKKSAEQERVMEQLRALGYL